MTQFELEELLASLGLRVIKRNNNLMACCPAHQERRPSWGISIDEPHMHGCFSCGFKGSLATLLRHFNWSPAQIESVTGPQETKVDNVNFSFTEQTVEPLQVEEYHLYPYKVTPRLLKYARSRGLSEATIRCAGIVYDHTQNRMLMPWYTGNVLVGATGRTLSSDPSVPKIIVYFGLQKGLSLYLPDRVINPNRPLILVEGEIDALRVYQAGFPNVAALAFGSFTKHQQKIVQSSGVSDVVLFFDDDSTGERLTERATEVLRSFVSIRRVSYPQSDEKQDPASFSHLQLRELLRKTLKASRFSLTF